MRDDDNIVELCRRKGTASSTDERWSTEFVGAGKKRLAGDTAGAARVDKVKDLRREVRALKEVMDDLVLEPI